MGEPAPDDGIMVLDLFGASGGDQFGQWSTANSCEWEVNNVRIAEKVEKKRLNGLQRVGSAELEQDYPQAPLSL